MSEEKVEQILEEMLSLRRELSEIRQLLEQSHSTSDQAIGSLERAVEEYRRLPSDDEDAIRWGFIGAWGRGGTKGAQHASYSIQTTSIGLFLDSTPNEEIVAFAKVFTNPNTIELCKYLFRNRNKGKVEKEMLKRECNLSEEELAAAIRPLLEWRFVEWKEEQLEAISQGVNFALTLIEMAKEGIKQKTNKWD
jgi:hypothetical protein